jgi:hypothetical protein
MKETGLDYADAYAKVKHDLGAESREKKSTATLNSSWVICARRTRRDGGRLTFSHDEEASILRDPLCPSRNLLLPLNVRVFCRLSSPRRTLSNGLQVPSAQALSPLRTKSFDGLLGGNTPCVLSSELFITL